MKGEVFAVNIRPAVLSEVPLGLRAHAAGRHQSESARSWGTSTAGVAQKRNVPCSMLQRDIPHKVCYMMCLPCLLVNKACDMNMLPSCS